MALNSGQCLPPTGRESNFTMPSPVCEYHGVQFIHMISVTLSMTPTSALNEKVSPLINRKSVWKAGPHFSTAFRFVSFWFTSLDFERKKKIKRYYIAIFKSIVVGFIW